MTKRSMNQKPGSTAIALALIVLSPFVSASPASKEYVDKQIKEAVEQVQIQIHQENTRIEAQITELKHRIGELYQGGVVFWLDESQQHGLVAARVIPTTGAGIPWRNGESGDKTTNARANGLFAGLSNTHLIISEQTIDDQEGQFAALIAHQFAVQEDGETPCNQTQACYGNWYLPSLAELQLIRQNLYLHGLGQWIAGRYWSSSEDSVSSAYVFDFGSGAQSSTDKAMEAHVLPIHAF
ncbi:MULTISPECIES: DUF1566 domain-containing protein [unclassified Legionella]|uniref:DUF1566 domain-containing protein n=1 Tax=unclassified Legionella TaxID=2622702 RepID=UPI001F5E8E87|nr:MULTISPECIES: DUF1566 domain-containing protein [unclassified Legionella]MDI9818654.1 DUF1566 domain-containing protein [Legionella sp. PL877]